MSNTEKYARVETFLERGWVVLVSQCRRGCQQHQTYGATLAVRSGTSELTQTYRQSYSSKGNWNF